MEQLTKADKRPSLALLGTGIFAKDAYLKFLGGLAAKVKLAFVWSRSQVSNWL